MSILRVCEECGYPVTDDPRIAREQAVCCCIKPKEGLAAIMNPYDSKETENGRNKWNL